MVHSKISDYPFTSQRFSPFVPPRIDQPELLDLGVGTPDEVALCLADLWRINRYLGGVRGITRYLYPRLKAHVGRCTVLDLGAGAAQISAAVARWSQRRSVEVIALDLSARNLAVAQTHTAAWRNAHLLQGDANRLPFASNTVDYVISSLFLHHFTPEQVVELLRSAYRAARRGIIMSDLMRGWLPWMAFKLVQPVFARSYLTRHDGALSVRRAYTPHELRELAEAAGLRNIEVHTYFPWRMTLVADK